jgi:simple sugar transport system substrate-binding protein
MKRNKSLLTLLLILLSGVMFLAACGGTTTPAEAPAEEAAVEEVVAPEVEEPAPEPTEAPEEPVDEEPMEEADSTGFTLAPEIAERVASGEPLRIYVSYHDVSNEFAPFLRSGVEQAAEELGVEAEFVGPVGSDAEAQIAELESLALAGVDGFAISSVSTDALAPLINRLLDEGIPVVTYNTDNPDSNRLAFAGQDLVTSGYAAAKVLADLMEGEGDVIITTLDAAAQWSIDRETGAREGFAEYPGINVLTTVNTGTEPQEIYANIENAMLANPSVSGILSLECCSTPPAGEYVKRNDLGDEVTVVGFDELPATLQLIQEGFIAGSVSQAPERQGFEAVNMLYQFLNGEELSDVDTGIEVIDQSNLDKYLGGEAGAEEQSESGADSGFTLAPEIAERVASGEPLRIYVSYHDVSNEFAPFLRSGVEQAAEELGVEAEFVGPVGSDAEAQIAELESLALAGVDGFAISSVSTDALAPLINRLLDEGIPVVTYNTDNPDSNRLAFAGQDLVTSGYAAAKVLADLMEGEGDVIITTLDAAAQWSIDRETGAREGFAEYPGINVLTTVNTGTEPQEIYANIENAMLANPSVSGILSLECCSTPPAGEYVKRNDLGDEVTVVGFDELPATLQLIQEGFIAGSVSQAPERQGFEAVNMLYQFLNGEELSDVDTGIEVIDLSNLDKYLGE